MIPATCRYFLQAFLSHPGGADGATLQVQTATVPVQQPTEPLERMKTASSLTANFDPDATAAQGGLPTTATLRRGANIYFKESSKMLEKIFEFLYLGEIAVLEETTTNIREEDYNVWMFLLTWCAVATPLDTPAASFGIDSWAV